MNLIRLASQRDCDELRPQWENALRVVNREDIFHDKYGRPVKQPYNLTTRAKITYDGDIKPPDTAFACFVNKWQPMVFGFQVNKVGHKIYEVSVNND